MSERRWFFEDEDAVVRLRELAKRLHGTPFRPYSCAPGRDGGMDCVGMCEYVMAHVGVIGHLSFPRAPADYAGHLHNDKILRYLRGQSNDSQSHTLANHFAEIPVSSLPVVAAVPAAKSLAGATPAATGLMAGDILLLKAELPGVWHMPIMLDARNFFHCAAPDGVTEADIEQHDYRKHVRAVFRARANCSGRRVACDPIAIATTP